MFSGTKKEKTTFWKAQVMCNGALQAHCISLTEVKDNLNSSLNSHVYWNTQYIIR